MENAIEIRQQAHAPLTVQGVIQQVAQIQQLMKAVMVESVHYGTIPGTNKPALLKAGAEKLLLMARLIPTFTKEQVDLGNGHREYTVRCEIVTESGEVRGVGYGSCSTLESKYRYRKSYEETLTDIPVPKAYWEGKNPAVLKKALADAGIEGAPKANRTPAGWFILAVKGDGERVENPDIADVYNTVLKIALKRSMVAATITTMAASDFFDQDTEEIFGMVKAESAPAPTAPAPKKPAPKKPAPAKPRQAQAPNYDEEPPPPTDEDLGFPDYEPQAEDSSQHPLDLPPARHGGYYYNIPYHISGVDGASFRQELKNRGFRFDGETKRWIHKTLFLGTIEVGDSSVLMSQYLETDQ